MRAPLATALVLLLAGCAAPQPIQVIDNILRHEGPAPPSPPLVRELLAQPLAAQGEDGRERCAHGRIRARGYLPWT